MKIIAIIILFLTMTVSVSAFGEQCPFGHFAWFTGETYSEWGQFVKIYQCTMGHRFIVVG